MAAVRDRHAEFGDGLHVAVVMFSAADVAAAYVARTSIPFPVLVDDQRVAYRDYGLERGTFGQVWSLGAAKRYAQILRRDGRRDLRRPTEDTRQLGGDFVIDGRGVLTWGHWANGPEDRPTVDELIRVVRSTRS